MTKISAIKNPTASSWPAKGFPKSNPGAPSYTSLFEHLRQNNPEQFSRLLTAEFASSKRGTRFYSEDPAQLRTAARIDDHLFAEVNLSANSIQVTICKLLLVFEIQPEEMQIFLQADRAGE